MTTNGLVARLNGGKGLGTAVSDMDIKSRLLADEVEKTAEHLMARTEHRPTVGIVCGSGIGGLADMVQNTDVFDYKDIPNFPISTVAGHAGRLVFGELNGKCCVCMKGRIHAYEGYPMWQLTFPIRVMAKLGVKVLIVTNAAGGLNPDYREGDLMIIKDHIFLPGLMGFSPLIGLNDERLGPRFVPMSAAYDKEIRRLAWSTAKELQYDFVREGVLIMQTGPCYESVAESNMFRLMGADCTGMSVCPEATVGAQCGMRVFGMSLVTNMCVMEYDTDKIADHEEVLETGRMRAKDMQQLVCKMVGAMEV